MYSYSYAPAPRSMGQQAPAPAPAPAPSAPSAAPSAATGVTIPSGWPWYRSIWYQPDVLGVPLVPVLLGVAGVYAVTAALAAKNKNGRA